MKFPLLAIVAAGLSGLFMSPSHAEIVISEFLYQGRDGTLGTEHEFVELTNIGSSPIDVTGWYFGDSAEPVVQPAFSLSGFGSIAAGESVIFTDLSEADFRTVWSTMNVSVRILGGSFPGLGRNDTIRIFDNGGNLMTQLAYGDEDFDDSLRFRYTTGNTTFSNLGVNDIYGWVFANDPAAWSGPINNLTSVNGDIGNPGYLNTSAVPEPGTYVMIGIGTLFLLTTLRRRAAR